MSQYYSFLPLELNVVSIFLLILQPQGGCFFGFRHCKDSKKFKLTLYIYFIY